MDIYVNPSSSPFNPTYSLGSTTGFNSIGITISQLPEHTHIATSVVTDPTHSHFTFSAAELVSGASVISTSISAGKLLSGAGDVSYTMVGDVSLPTLSPTSAEATGITVNTTNATEGSDQEHINYQPALGCYYIMYIP